MLQQKQTDNTWRLLQCGSRHLTETEARYSATEVELLAGTSAVTKTRLFVTRADFELKVDHKLLILIINSKKLAELSTQRIERMKERLAGFRMKASWQPGSKHKLVDSFSRNPVDDPDADDIQSASETEELYLLAAGKDNEDGSAIIKDSHVTRLRMEGQQDPVYQKPHTCNRERQQR